MDVMACLVQSVDLYPQCLWRPKGNGAIYYAIGELQHWDEIEQAAKIQSNSDLTLYAGQRFENNSRPDKDLHQEWSYLGKEGRWWLPLAEVIIAEDSITIQLWRKKNHQYQADVISKTINYQNFQPAAIPTSIYYESNPNRLDWQRDYSIIEDYLDQGLEKIVWARMADVTLANKLSAKDILFQILEIDPTHYSIWHAMDKDHCFLSHTPEKLYHREGQYLEVDSIAGTRKRGANEQEDFALAGELFQNSKERREQQIVTDFVVEKLKTVCDKVEVPEVPRILRLKNVQHLCSQVRGKLNLNITDTQILQMLHPTPALGGHPRNMAMELIELYANFNRGNYGAPFGRFTREDSQVAVAIRSLLHAENRVFCFAGCGLVLGSDEEAEWVETSAKMQPLLKYFILQDQANNSQHWSPTEENEVFI
jgi:isochorismate synthase